MPRPKLIVPSVSLHVHIPQDVYTRTGVLLYSEAEHRVPLGAWQAHVTMCMREFLEYRELDLSPWLGGQPGGNVIKGLPTTLDELKKHLNSKG